MWRAFGHLNHLAEVDQGVVGAPRTRVVLVNTSGLSDLENVRPLARRPPVQIWQVRHPFRLFHHFAEFHNLLDHDTLRFVGLASSRSIHLSQLPYTMRDQPMLGFGKSGATPAPKEEWCAAATPHTTGS